MSDGISSGASEGEKRAILLRNLAKWEDNVAHGIVERDKLRAELAEHEADLEKDIAKRDALRAEVAAIYSAALNADPFEVASARTVDEPRGEAQAIALTEFMTRPGVQINIGKVDASAAIHKRLVEYICRGGEIAKGHAHLLRWDCAGEDDDIIAYRIVSPDTEVIDA